MTQADADHNARHQQLFSAVVDAVDEASTKAAADFVSEIVVLVLDALSEMTPEEREALFADA